MSNLKMEAVLAFVKENAIYGDPQSVLDTIDTYAMDGSLDQKRFLMNIGPEKGKILVDTIKKNKSKKILELGSFLGYSAVLIGMSIDDDGELISIDPDPNSIAIASQLVEFAGLSSKVSFIKGKAEHAINDLDRSFDLIFIDHAKKRYADCSRAGEFALPEDDDDLACKKLIEGLYKINKDFEVPSMKNFGINQKNFEDELENMATDAETSGAPNLNPRVPSVNEMVDLYGQAWRAF